MVFFSENKIHFNLLSKAMLAWNAINFDARLLHILAIGRCIVKFDLLERALLD